MRFAVSLIFGLAGLGPVIAQAQCVECAQQMFQATLSTNIQYSMNQDMIDQNRRRDASNGICYESNRNFGNCGGRSSSRGPSVVAPAVASQAESAVLTALDAEYRRRLQRDGSGSASRWLNLAAGDAGRLVGRLDAEYRRRASANGKAAADRWYVESARQIAARQVGGNASVGTGEAVINGVPAATRKRAEDATFAIVEPEINRRSRSEGQAKAVEWARSVGLAVGAGARNLAPEYALRAKVDGRPGADSWYVEQARTLALRQVGSGR